MNVGVRYLCHTRLSVLGREPPEVDCRSPRQLFLMFQGAHPVFHAAAPFYVPAQFPGSLSPRPPAPAVFTWGVSQPIRQEWVSREAPPAVSEVALACRLPQGVSLQDLLSQLGRPFKEYELWALSHACLSALRTHHWHPGDTRSAVSSSVMGAVSTP